MGHSMPTPPLEDNHKAASRRQGTNGKSSSKSSAYRASKRVTTHVATHTHSPSEAHSPTSADSRHKRVWKACERCRMKKTKCDGEFPCKRCKDDGLVCTAGLRKKTEYKQLPRGYAEVLESTQFALIATIHRLYAMVRNSERWELGEPELNDRGQPIVHNIATLLGCIRPNADIDLPVHSVFPEDTAGLTELVRQLEEQQQKDREEDKPAAANAMDTESTCNSSSCNRTERDSSSELDTSDFEEEYARTKTEGNGEQLLSPQSLAPYNDFDVVTPEMNPTAASLFPTPTNMSRFPNWQGMDVVPDFLQTPAMLSSIQLLNQGLLESEFGTLKPHVVSCPNPEVMMGMGDPMMYSGYDGEPMRL